MIPNRLDYLIDLGGKIYDYHPISNYQTDRSAIEINKFLNAATHISKIYPTIQIKLTQNASTVSAESLNHIQYTNLTATYGSSRYTITFDSALQSNLNTDTITLSRIKKFQFLSVRTLSPKILGYYSLLQITAATDDTQEIRFTTSQLSTNESIIIEGWL
jgi:hypothetical protein